MLSATPRVIIPQLLQNVISHEAAPALFLGWNRTLAFYLALTRFSIYFPENGSKVWVAGGGGNTAGL